MTSPTARTLAECRKRGWTAQVVEKWNPHARIRQDLFDVIDVVAAVQPHERILQDVPSHGHQTVRIEPGHILGIQATSMANRTARIAKIHASEKAQAWMRSGGRISVWAWRKLKVKRGGKAVRWELHEELIEPKPGATPA